MTDIANTQEGVDPSIYHPYLETIRAAGLDGQLLHSEYRDRQKRTVKAYFIRVTGGARPVDVWPHTGTVYANPVYKNKRRIIKSKRVKGLSAEAAIYLAIQISHEEKP